MAVGVFVKGPAKPNAKVGILVKNGSLPVPQYQAPLGGGKFAQTPQQKALNQMKGLV